MEPSTTTEAAIDEALRESFPASDAPAWTGVHAGTPVPAIPIAPALLRVDLVRALREDVRLLKAEPGHLEERFRALDLGVKRRPEDCLNVEAVIPGTILPDRSIVVVAGIDSPSDVALLFAIARSFGERSAGRTLRLAVLGSTARYAEDLRRSGVRVDTMLGLERLGCGRRVVAVPRHRSAWPSLWLRPGSRTCHHVAFVRRGMRGIMLTDVGRRRPCDYERLGVIAEGLVRIVHRLTAA